MADLQPEARWTASIAEGLLSVTQPEGDDAVIPLVAIRGIRIVTNDSGPWGADVWWMFDDASGAALCSYPQGVTGEQSVVDWAVALPGFDHEALIRAMSSTDNAEFIVWKRAT